MLYTPNSPFRHAKIVVINNISMACESLNVTQHTVGDSVT